MNDSTQVSGWNERTKISNGASAILNRLRHQIGVSGRVLFSIWLLLMILIPHIWLLGDRPMLVLALSLAIAVQMSLVLTILSPVFGAGGIFKIGLFVILAAWLSEVVGVHTGLPFGSYTYTEALQPQIAGVPVQVPAAWLMMLPAAWAVGASLIYRRGQASKPRSWLNMAAFAATAGLAFSAWDLFLDPQMVAWQLWSWETPGHYFGIPLLNFLGWTLIAAALSFGASFGIETDSLPIEALLLVYSTAWLLESVGLGLFFGLPGPAAAGFAGMGIFAALAWRKVLAGST